MDPFILTLIIVGSFILLSLIVGMIFMFVYTNKIANRLFIEQWTRQDKNKFKRGCSDKNFDYHLKMFNDGMKFHDEHIDNIKEISITSMGLRLQGEYYDFGFSRCVIILPGRMETCLYGAAYVEAYLKAGYNVFCPDPRAHGLSEGDKISLGKYEAVDVLNWAKYLHDELHNKTIVLYGICGGATASCFALTNKDCPNYINGFIADGMFYSFFRLYKRHIIDEKKPVFPVIYELMHKFKKYNDVNPYECAPHKMIKSIHVPTLILSGTKDIFAVPKEAKIMFDNSPAKNKKLVYIENGRHSHLRYDNQKAYDDAVFDFLKSIE